MGLDQAWGVSEGRPGVGHQQRRINLGSSAPGETLTRSMMEGIGIPAALAEAPAPAAAER